MIEKMDSNTVVAGILTASSLAWWIHRSMTSKRQQQRLMRERARINNNDRPPQSSDGIDPLHISTRADLKVFQDRYHQNPKDSENLRMLGSTLLRLARVPARGVDAAQVFSWIHDSISKLEEALEINKDDHDAMYLLANAHYMLFTRAESYSDFYVDHCRKAYGYFKYLKEKAPEVYERDPDMLKRIRRYLPQGMLDSNLDYKSFTGNMNTIDPSLSLYFHERSKTMEEEEMIQAEVEKLLAALPYDDNSELFEKLAEFSHRHKKKTKQVYLLSMVSKKA